MPQTIWFPNRPCNRDPLFPEMSAIVRARASTRASKITCAIYRKREIIVFSLFVLLLYFSPKEKLFTEGFFIEDYIQEI